MTKFRLYWDKDAETKWLNEMADEGWAMTGFFAGFYRFEESEKGKWRYQVDFGEKFGGVTEDYREFMNEAGIEIVQNWGYWVILRKLASEGEFQLYTDVESSIEHYSKILTMFKVVFVIELICLFIEIFGALSGSEIGWVFACIVGAFTFGILNAAVKTKNKILELKARQSGIDPEKDERQFSPALMAGLLMNSCALLMDHPGGLVKMILQILAIVLMVVGIAQTAAKCRK